MLQKLWQWLKSLFQRLFNPSKAAPVPVSPPDTPPPPKPLTDIDIEFLFTQLLEGVVHGWQSHRIQKFFEQSEDRISFVDWVNWLERFGQRVLDSPTYNLELARRLDLLARQAQYLENGWAEVAAVSAAISSQLFQRQIQGDVWEYDGPDGEMPPGPAPHLAGGQEVMTLEQLLERMTEDADLRQAIAQQVGIESDDPQILIQALVETLMQQQQELQEESPQIEEEEGLE